jgi:hypothetical protein
MSEISFQLLRKHRESLMAVLPAYSEIWIALRYAFCPTSSSLPDAHYQILCDPAGAEALLHAARMHCPEAVDDIELGIERRRALHR